MDHRSGDLIVILSGILFGFSPILYSLAVPYGATAYTNIFFRGLFASGLCFLSCVLRKKPLRLEPGNLRYILPLGCVSICTILFLCLSYSFIGVGMATALHFLYPVFITLILSVCCHESLKKRYAFALVLAVAGMAVSALRGGEVSPAGILLAAGSGVTHAVYMILLDRSPLRTEPAEKVLFRTSMMVTLAMGMIGIFFHGTVKFSLDPRAYLYLFGYAVCAGFLGHAFLKIGIERIGSKRAGILSLSEPVSAVLFGIVFLHEMMDGRKAVGMILLFTAILLVLLDFDNGDEAG